MKMTQRADHLVMRWVPVDDERGRTRMEAVWVSLAEVAPVTTRSQEQVPAGAAAGHAA